MIGRQMSFVAVVAAVLLLSGLDIGIAAASATPVPFHCGGEDGGTPSASAPATLRGSTPVPAGSPLFHLVADVPLPGSASRFDYQSLDATSGRLYIAHMGADQIVVVDTRTQQVVGTVGDVKTPTGVLVVPALSRVFAAASGSHDVAVVDAKRLRVIAHAGQIGFPDGLAYAPAAQQVFVSDESGGGELVINATTNAAATTIDIGGEAGNTHFDPVSGCILVAVQNRNQLAAIDPGVDRVVARYDLDADCQTPHGLSIDAARRLAFVSCEDNAKLLAVDLRTMDVLATYPVGVGPDVLAFDPGWHWLYVAAESGVVSVFAETAGGLTPLGMYKAPHAHSVAVDPATHRVYLPLENVDGKPVLRILAPAGPAPA